MTEPLVCCLCLTKDRPAMLKRAIASFRAQTYPNKRLYILDSGVTPAVDSLPDNYPDFGIMFHRTTPDKRTIGELRNYANMFAVRDVAEILMHADDDDWSHPNRIAEQVALLQASGAECVGYNEVLFFDERIADLRPAATHRVQAHDAYIYRNYSPDYCIGSSMMYLRSAWQRVKFDHINHGEDERFLRRVKSVGVSGFGTTTDDGRAITVHNDPLMICSIHGGNSSHYDPERERNTYARAPQWDAYCAREMEIK